MIPAVRFGIPLLLLAPLAVVAGCGSSGGDTTATTGTTRAAAEAKDLRLVVKNSTATALVAQPTAAKGSFDSAPSTDPATVEPGASVTFHFSVPSRYATYEPDGGALRRPGPRFTLVLTQGDATADVPLRVRLSNGPRIPESPHSSWFVDAWAPGETSGNSCNTPWSTELGSATATVTCSSAKLTKTPSQVEVTN